MNKDKTSYTQQPSSFENAPLPADSNHKPRKKRSTSKKQKQYIYPVIPPDTANLSTFELLQLAIRQLISEWCEGTDTEEEYAFILQSRYLDNFKDVKTALIMKWTSHRVRQIRIKIVSQLMGKPKKRQACLDPELVRRLKSEAAGLVARDADEVLANSKGGILPSSLLDFVDMNVFEDLDVADQRFISPNNQNKSVRRHIFELVKLLRASYTPTETSTAASLLSSALEKQDIAFNEAWFHQIIASHHWIETIGTRLQLSYEGLRHPSLQIARIIYEHKKIHKDDIARIYRERETDKDEKLQESQLSAYILAKKKDKRFQILGKSGIWTFQEETIKTENKPIMEVLKEYLSAQGGMINLNEAETHVQSLGYYYPLHTLRCYLLTECVSSISDPDLLCKKDCTEQHPGMNWRKPIANCKPSKKTPAYYHETIDKLKEMLEQAENHRMVKREIVQICKLLIPEGVNKKNIYKIINNKVGEQIRQVEIDGTDYLELNTNDTETHVNQ